MRRISSCSLIVSLLFFSAVMNGFSQKKTAAFVPTLSSTPDKPAAPQLIDPDALTQAQDFLSSPVGIIDEKKQPIAAQTGKKGKRCLRGPERMRHHHFKITT